MGNQYQQLNMEERNRLQRGLNQGMSLRAVARASAARRCARSRREFLYHNE